MNRINTDKLPESTITRFESKIEKQGDCWIWNGSRRAGQPGQMGFTVNADKVESPKRVAYKLYIGEIPPGRLLLATCDTEYCINPHHMNFSAETPPLVLSRRDVARFWNKVDKTTTPDGCWTWKGQKIFGYGKFSVGITKRRAHAVSYAIANGVPIPPGELIRHTCDNRACVRPDHLIPGTHQDNCNDKKARNRCSRNSGETNGNSKFTPELVRAIRADRKAGMKLMDIVAKHKISLASAGKICKRQLWAHIPDEDPTPPITDGLTDAVAAIQNGAAITPGKSLCEIFAEADERDHIEHAMDAL